MTAPLSALDRSIALAARLRTIAGVADTPNAKTLREAADMLDLTRPYDIEIEAFTSKAVTVMTAAKITELVTKFPNLGIDTFVHERDYNQMANGREELRQRFERACARITELESSRETKTEPAYTEKDVAAIVAAVDAVRATKAVTPLTLRDFGFAPGNYSSICFACGAEFIGDKRAIQCEPCAGKKLARSSEKSGEKPECPVCFTAWGGCAHTAKVPRPSAPASPPLSKSASSTDEAGAGLTITRPPQ